MRLNFGQILDFFFSPTVMHRIFKKLRRYFPYSLGIQESFREIAARRKRVNIQACFIIKFTSKKVNKEVQVRAIA